MAQTDASLPSRESPEDWQIALCELIVLTPSENEVVNSPHSSVVMEWTLNRPLAADHYFFIVIVYEANGLVRLGGTFRDLTPGWEVMDGIRDTSFVLHPSDFVCADDGRYTWQVQVRRQLGSDPHFSDPILCFDSGMLTWYPFLHCQMPVTWPTANCQVTLKTPPNDAQFGPETKNVVLQWQLNRALEDNEYFFVDVEFPHGGQTWHDGTWRDASRQLPDGTRDTSFALRDHLCQPGFSDTGQYTWHVAVLNQLGPEKSLSDSLACQSDRRAFTWTGCVPRTLPPPLPEPERDEDRYPTFKEPGAP